MMTHKLNSSGPQSLYQSDLAYIHSTAFEDLARGAAADIIERLRASSAPVRSILDVGCGAGPLTKALVEAGFDATGLDTSTALLDMARARVQQARFIHASAYDTDMGKYDAVVALGESLTYHPEGADADRLIVDFFQRVAHSLPAGGILIFDFIGLGEPSLDGRTWRSGEDWAVLVETSENHAERALVRSIEVFRRVEGAYRRSHEVHQVRLLDPSTLCRQLSSLGFATEISQSYGAQQLPPRRHVLFATRLPP